MSTTNPDHPKAVAARELAGKRQAQRNQMQQELQKALKAGCRFASQATITAAYKVHKRDVIHLSTAVRHPTDKHDALAAKYLAQQRLCAGQYITLRRPPAVIDDDSLFGSGRPSRVPMKKYIEGILCMSTMT